MTKRYQRIVSKVCFGLTLTVICGSFLYWRCRGEKTSAEEYRVNRELQCSLAMDLLPESIDKCSPRPPLLENKLRLYSGGLSPFVERVRLVLAFKGIDFELVQIDLVNKPEWYVKEVNPLTGKVPVLELPGGKCLQESIPCCEYLEEVYPEPHLYPNDPYEKNRQRLLIQLYSKASEPFYKIVFGGRDEANIAAYKKALAPFERELERRNSTYLAGEKPGMVDYILWPLFERQAIIRDDLVITDKDFPRLIKWAEVMSKDPVVKKVGIPGEHHYRVFQEVVLPPMRASRKK